MYAVPIRRTKLHEAPSGEAPTKGFVNKSSLLKIKDEQPPSPTDWLAVDVVAGSAAEQDGFVLKNRTRSPTLEVPSGQEIDLAEFAMNATTAGREHGINRDLLVAIAVVRTNLSNHHEEVGGQMIVGPYMISVTEWIDLCRKYPDVLTFLGVAKPVQQIIAAAASMADNAKALEASLGKPATSTQLYLAHVIGAGAAAAVIQGNQLRPIGDALREFYRAAGHEAQASAVLERNAGLFREGANERSVEAVLATMANQLTEARPKVAEIVALLPKEDRGGRVGADGEPAWMPIARGELGVKELTNGSNPAIEEYHKAAGASALDDVPWCSSFVNWCIRKSDLHGIEPTQSKMARSWQSWGEPIEEPVPGCVVVLRRGDHPNGHVAFFERWEDGKMMLLGGNQGNEVSIAAFPQRDVLPDGFRMPRGMTPLDATGQRALDIDVLARTLWGEARGESAEGREAIAAVILNRLDRRLPNRFGSSIAGVCRHRQQFSCWNEDDPNLEKLRAVTPDNAIFRECLEIATKAVDRQLVDPTEGSDHYHTAGVSPDWSRGKTPVRTIGRHLFFNDIA